MKLMFILTSERWVLLLRRIYHGLTSRHGWIDEEYHRRYGRFNIEKIWRDDILPCRVYLRHWYVHHPLNLIASHLSL